MSRGCATGHPGFVVSASSANQVMAQIEPWQRPEDYNHRVYVLPGRPDEEVASLHLTKIAANHTRLSDGQTACIGLPADGPFRPEHYGY